MPKKTRFYQNKTLWTWFILILFVLSTVGIVMQYRTEDNTNTRDYKGQRFYVLNPGFMTVIDNQQTFFTHHPEDLESIPAQFNLNLNSEKIYLTYNPKDNISFDNSMNKLGQIIFSKGVRPVKACISEEECPDIPIVDCEEQTPKFYFKTTEQDPSITNLDNCIILNAGSKEDMDKLIEYIHFNILGII